MSVRRFHLSVRRRLYSTLYDRAVSTPPVIVAGMHRSGTTLLVKILGALGVFMGADQSQNAESKLFQEVNRLTLDAFGSSWRSSEFLPSTDELASHYDARIAEVHLALRRRLVPEYWGGARALMMRRNIGLWGWKDPRNSLLLPLWNRTFPGARLVSIVRDGRDVALSLDTRDTSYSGRGAAEVAERNARLQADLELWELYNERIEEAADLFTAHHTIRFERLLEEPADELDRLASFLGCSAEPARETITGLIDASRMRRYEVDASTELFETFRGLKTYGYGSTGADDTTP